MIAGMKKTKKVVKQIRMSWGKIASFFGLGVITGVLLLISIARLTWHTKFYPGVSVANVELAGLTREQAKIKLSQAVENYELHASFNGSSWVVPKQVISFDIDGTLNEAYHYGRRLDLADYLLLLVGKKTNYTLTVSMGIEAEPWLSQIASSVELPPQIASVEVVKNKIKVTQGVDGIVIDRVRWEREILTRGSNLATRELEIPIKTVQTQLGGEELAKLEERANKLLGAHLTIQLEDEKNKLDGSELVGWLYTGMDSQVIDVPTVNEYVRGLAESWDRQPIDAKFEFADGKVVEFAPSKDGLEIQVDESTKKIVEAVIQLISSDELEQTVQVVAEHTPPAVTTDKVNELGIKERIGRGESYYYHSIPNRIYNVDLASSRLNSALISPGEEVSFNKLVGEVSGATGYRPAYVIANGRTELGDGGGLCQVSTTMFRAAMAAGLPITERWGHAYRVSYYELDSKPGVDATVYAPSKDLKFINDTPGHILIQTINDPKKLHLIIEIYGTSDGRVATISTPKVWGITPPLPTVYQDDPTLPAGTLRQVDWAASGAKASFEYKVVRNGETLQEKTFSTSYRPWAAVYLRGTAQ